MNSWVQVVALSRPSCRSDHRALNPQAASDRSRLSSLQRLGCRELRSGVGWRNRAPIAPVRMAIRGRVYSSSTRTTPNMDTSVATHSRPLVSRAGRHRKWYTLHESGAYSRNWRRPKVADHGVQLQSMNRPTSAGNVTPETAPADGAITDTRSS